jgi:phosphoglycolate phosphatase-like HAD superfamily hydrolase
MIKLVAFDWNGTLLADTICCWEGSAMELKVCGRKPMSLLKFRQTFTIPYIECLVANGADRKFVLKNSKKISKAFHDFYEPRASKCRTRGGVRKALAWLKGHKIKSMIYSNHTVVGIEAQLKRLKIRCHMDVVLAHEDMDGALHTKNKSQKLYTYVKSNKLKPKEVMAVGDTVEEIEIGKHYGFYTVGITGGYNTTAMLKKHNPDFLIHNMKDLVKIVKKLNS